MHSDVLNCDNRAHFPTPGAPSIATKYESAGPLCDDIPLSGAFIGLTGGIKLVLRDRRRLNESPLLTMPKHAKANKVNGIHWAITIEK